MTDKKKFYTINYFLLKAVLRYFSLIILFIQSIIVVIYWDTYLFGSKSSFLFKVLKWLYALFNNSS